MEPVLIYTKVTITKQAPSLHYHIHIARITTDNHKALETKAPFLAVSQLPLVSSLALSFTVPPSLLLEVLPAT